MIAGGTYSSWQLRKCLQLAKECESYYTHPEYESIYAQIKEITALWRKVLAKHNAKELKFVEYDLETGLHLDGTTPMEPIRLKKPIEPKGDSS
jgi:hypothetical protein